MDRFSLKRPPGSGLSAALIAVALLASAAGCACLLSARANAFGGTDALIVAAGEIALPCELHNSRSDHVTR